MFQSVDKRLPHPSKLDRSSSGSRIRKLEKVPLKNQKFGRSQDIKMDCALDSSPSDYISLRQVTKSFRKRKEIVNNLKDIKERRYDEKWITYRVQDISEKNRKYVDDFKLEKVVYFPLLNKRSKSLVYFPLLNHILNDDTIQPIHINYKSLAKDVERELEMEEKNLNEEMLGDEVEISETQDISLTQQNQDKNNSFKSTFNEDEKDLKESKKETSGTNLRDETSDEHELCGIQTSKLSTNESDINEKKVIKNIYEIENNNESTSSKKDEAPTIGTVSGTDLATPDQTLDDMKGKTLVQVEHIHHYHHYYHEENQGALSCNIDIKSHEVKEIDSVDIHAENKQDFVIDLDQIMNPSNYCNRYSDITKVSSEEFFKKLKTSKFVSRREEVKRENDFDIPQSIQELPNIKVEKVSAETLDYPENSGSVAGIITSEENPTYFMKTKEKKNDFKEEVLNHKNENLKNSLFEEIEKQAQILENELLSSSGKMNIIEKRLDEEYTTTLKKITEEYSMKRKDINEMLIGHNNLNAKLVTSSNSRDSMNSSQTQYAEKSEYAIYSPNRRSMIATPKVGKTRLKSRKESTTRKEIKDGKTNGVKENSSTMSPKEVHKSRPSVYESKSLLSAQQELNEAKTIMEEIDSLISEIQTQKASQ